ncbi:class I SAM-dependent methyltransferase [Alteromonas aestuariivivens]|uniref:Ribosomal RNA small subunit methyltransferase C n=1 Tax=Alteromonas aestuariivivens TaxID=1938339 RepID=A0A3D8M769_9ALTE|nr:class I SAM-dependent methyltransferase [Alteromonas aestuariivivens]RDV25568.1 class I SAM-dependent methyltransferase [Alteromonas aestuariivivens]
MMLSPQSQLLERNLEMFEMGEWLLVNPADAYFTDLLSHRELHVLHQYFDVFSESVRVVPSITLDSRDISNSPQGFSVEQQVGNHLHTFSPFSLTQGRYTDVLIYLPKAKAHLQMLLQMAASCVKPGGNIHLVGENKGGIKSAAKLSNHYGTTIKVDSARHCSLLTTSVEQPAGLFDPEKWLEYREYETLDVSWHVASLPGVFSHTQLDDGTELLLQKVAANLSGTVLDFACGSGVVGSYLLKQYPHLGMVMSDVSAPALYSAARTLSENNQAATLIAANGLHGVDEKFNHIVTNPPFHTGIKTDYSITKRFISDARRLLKGSGTLTMVANRFLPYPGLLQESFPQVRTVAQNSKFSIYLAISG